jgi:hypothetical protein
VAREVPVTDPQSDRRFEGWDPLMLAILPHQGTEVIVEWAGLHVRALVLDRIDPDCTEDGIGGWTVEVREFLQNVDARTICGVLPELGNVSEVSLYDSPVRVIGTDGEVIWEREQANLDEGA